jgi:hypothetical protein
MGCDIHFFVEKKSTAYKRNESINKVLEEHDVIDPDWTLVQDEWCDDRNYRLFGILAGVRTSPKEGPIVEPRGFPDDASDDLSDNYKSWGLDAHSASYITLTELLNVDWKKYEDDYADGVYLDGFLKSIEKMKEIDTNSDNVRCVFWFDN